MGIPGLLGEPGLPVLACLLKDPGLPWSEGLFLNPVLLGIPGLFGAPGLFGKVCLKEMFCLLFFWLDPSLLIGAPTSSGGDVLLLIFFVFDLFEFWSGLFDICPPPPEFELFWAYLLDLLLLLLVFFGLAISWIGGFIGLFIGKFILFRKVVLSLSRFCEVLIFISWFLRFARDCELLVIVGLLSFLGWFDISFRFSGLLRGFIINGFLFELFLRGFSFMAEIKEDSSFLFCL